VLQPVAQAEAAAGDQRSAASTRLLIGYALEQRGDTTPARRAIQRALSAFRAVGDPVGEAANVSDAVDLELDLYWVARGGKDPESLIREHGARIRLVHAKDLAADGEHDAPVGEGTLDWPGIVSAAAESAVRWYIVEQDEPADAFADLERALRNLRRLGGLRSDLPEELAAAD
jgi:hypothetical protein